MKRVKFSSLAFSIAALFLSATQSTGVLGAGLTATQKNRLQSLAKTLQERSRDDRWQAAQYTDSVVDNWVYQPILLDLCLYCIGVYLFRLGYVVKNTQTPNIVHFPVSHF